MNRFIFLVFAAVVLGDVSFADSKPKYGPSPSPRATPLAQSSEFFRKASAPDFWALVGYYVPQFNGAACSVASVSMILNAARAKLEAEGKLKRSSEDRVVSQQDLLEKVKVVNWKDRIMGSIRGATRLMRGVTLEQLGQVVQESFRVFGLPEAKVRVVHADPAGKGSLLQFKKDLELNEASARSFVLVNYLQSAATQDEATGHIAPLGAYDSHADRVLVLDPDREYYEPYWVSVQALYEGMATRDGPKNRGYIWVEY